MERREQLIKVFRKLSLISNQLQAEGDKLSQDLTLKQWMFLLRLMKLKDEELSIQDITGYIGGSRQNTKKLVVLLEKKGFVEIKPSLKDSRALCVKPTEQAQKFFRQNKEAGYSLLERAFKGIEDAELELLIHCFMRIEYNLEEKEDENN